MITIQPVPLLTDNYAWLLRDAGTGAIAIVDPAEPAPVAAAVDAAGGRLDLILHPPPRRPRRRRRGAPRPLWRARDRRAADAHRLPTLDQAVAEGDAMALGDATAHGCSTPRATPTATSPSVSPTAAALLCGDTLFSLGCGRLLEGTASEMFASLRKLAALPPETLVYCGHEYTENNARFALHADPANAALVAYAGRVRAMRAEGRPSVPSRLADELAANPFLRAGDVASFADLRARKDKF